MYVAVHVQNSKLQSKGKDKQCVTHGTDRMQFALVNANVKN